MAAFSSTIFSLSPFSATSSLSRPTTATTENLAPAGFQHLVQPQAWLWAMAAPIFTFTGLDAHLHTRTPPWKLSEPLTIPLSIDGCRLVLAGAAAFFLKNPNISSSSEGVRRDCNAVSPVERAPNFSFSEHDYGSDGLAFVHQVEGLVDAVERQGVGDHRVDLDLPVHVPVDDLGGVGAAEGVVGPAVGQGHQVGDEVAVDLLGVDEVGHAEAAAPLLLAVVEVHADDLVGADHLQALDHVQPDAAEAEHHAVGAGLDLGGVDHRADPGGDAAADVAGLVEGGVGADLGQGDLRQHRVVGEGRAAHVVVDRRALVAEAAGAVGHQPLALGGADRGAQVGLAREAAFALPALGRVERDHVVARLHRGHAGAHLHHHAGALVAEDRGEQAFAVQAVQGVGVGVADARGLDLH